MDDVSTFFKNGFLNLHKTKIGKEYQQKTLNDRMNIFNNMRRQTRNTFMFQKRNIDENMSPINTPEPLDINRVVKKERKTNKRLEMLYKWKEEKEKRKQEEKQKMKPLFKVYHVPIEMGLPNLENVNKEIKGKPLSQFAPPNHTFHAPKNIKPIHINTTTDNMKLNKPKLRKNLLNVGVNRMASTVSQSTTRMVTRSRLAEQRGTQVGMDRSKIENKTTKDLLKPKHQSTPAIEKVGHEIKQTACSPKNVLDTKNSTLKNRYNKAYTEMKKRQNTLGSREEIPHKRDKETKETPRTPKKIAQTPKKNQKEFVEVNSTKCSPPKKSKKNSKTYTSHVTSVSTEETFPRNREPKNTVSSVQNTPNKNLKSLKKATNHKEVNTLDKEDEYQIEKPNELRKKPTKPINKNKNIGWNVIEIIDGDDEILSKNINNRTPKTNSKKYNKTPRKINKIDNSINETEINETLKYTEDPVQKDTPTTPTNKSIKGLTSPVYISPFVTVSRGKTSARKEYRVRHSLNNISDTPDFKINISVNTSPKAGAEYFLKKLNDEIARIEDICRKWNIYREEQNVPEEANDMIDVAIGQSKLLISKKFQQFKSLIEQCRSDEYVERPVTCEDLHGFWDMIYMQVEDLNKRFNNLENLKANNWKEIIPEKKPIVKRGKGRPKKMAASSSLKDMIKAAREKKKSNNDPNEATNPSLVSECNDAKVFSGGNYSIKSPVQTNALVVPTSTRRSLRVSLLAHQIKNRHSSPGLTMMKISQAIKCGDGLTPGKSILKSDVTRSANTITKTVLFKDDLEEDIEENLTSGKARSPCDHENKENNVNELNLITFSPQTPVRKSRRLSKCK